MGCCNVVWSFKKGCKLLFIDPHVPSGDPVIEELLHILLDPSSGLRYQQQKPECVGKQSGGNQHYCGNKNKQAINELLRRQRAMLKLLPYTVQGINALMPGENRSECSGGDDQEHGIEQPYRGTDFQQDEQFDKRQCGKE